MTQGKNSQELNEISPAFICLSVVLNATLFTGPNQEKKSLCMPSPDWSFTSPFTKKIPLFVDEQKSARKDLQATSQSGWA